MSLAAAAGVITAIGWSLWVPFLAFAGLVFVAAAVAIWWPGTTGRAVLGNPRWRVGVGLSVTYSRHDRVRRHRRPDWAVLAGHPGRPRAARRDASLGGRRDSPPCRTARGAVLRVYARAARSISSCACRSPASCSPSSENRPVPQFHTP